MKTYTLKYVFFTVYKNEFLCSNKLEARHIYLSLTLNKFPLYLVTCLLISVVDRFDALDLLIPIRIRQNDGDPTQSGSGSTALLST
jgi:hypothetical protein